jgi:hypothetical protein
MDWPTMAGAAVLVAGVAALLILLGYMLGRRK